LNFSYTLGTATNSVGLVYLKVASIKLELVRASDGANVSSIGRE
jgi:hypothetical protein